MITMVGSLVGSVSLSKEAERMISFEEDLPELLLRMLALCFKEKNTNPEAAAESLVHRSMI